ncbi:MAG: AAA family ATPase [Hyphomicrobiales bacterium]
MYSRFFGLKDDPFKLAFDPAYLFMGRHHEEATAHLRYAVAEGEGFTAITGERGIGKSTLCRAFVDSMAAKASMAFLSSPLPTAKDLLQRMNLQFGISAEGQSAKDLIDALNEYLMQQRIAGRKVAVFIDDAQTLAPEVLEQVRLISNLETTRDKLIQIVLIGEPELMKMLDSRELRQMGQRVSVCYEIGPLAAEETAAYIQHRLSVASAGPPMRFDPAAVRQIFRHSRGNPRRVNIACSAALAGAFKARQKEVSVAIAQAAINDLEGPEPVSKRLDAGRRKPMWAVAAAVALVLAAAAGVFVLWPNDKRPPLQAEAVSTPAQVDAAQQSAAAEPPAVEPVPDPALSAAPPEEKPPTQEASIPSRMTHSVQVGAFLYPENAEHTAAQLSSKGYSTKIFQTTDSKGRTWYTVRIGDYPSRQIAQAQANEFSRREHMESVVRPFGGF